ncbi:hypothetical protein ACEWPM_004210 [Roseovarius sp. S4756]|uniref:hypothetical protein n=1 Tax=Roseovarius maritimus TaxID=3342637 RepID=UPI0037293493
MAEPLPPEMRAAIQSISAAGRSEIETALSPGRARRAKLFREGLYLLGGLALGCFSAGLAVFLTAIVLNLLFHYSPP